jgi:hypothetical protein
MPEQPPEKSPPNPWRPLDVARAALAAAADRRRERDRIVTQALLEDV